jgi:hypothetical protein
VRRLAPRLLAVLAPFAVWAAGAVPAAAVDPQPLRIADLRVEGGEAAWHAKEEFRLDWEQVPGPPFQARAVVYRLYDPADAPVGEAVRNTEVVHMIERLRVPSTPGIYTAEIWLEDAEGRAGPHATATLRFDDVAPSPPAPQTPPGWLGGSQPALLEIGHPPGPLPISGIRGYAVSLDRGGGSSPCAQGRWCSLAETDLAGGIGDDSVALGTLPEGTTLARVVAVSSAGVASEVATAAFSVDATHPQVSLLGAPAGWSDRPLRLTALATDQLSGMAAAGPSGPFTAIAVDGGGFSLGWGDSVSTSVGGSGVHGVAFYARDAAGNVADGSAGPPFPQTATVRIDEDPPRVAFAAAQDPAEPERIEATVADPLSGPSAERGSIAVRPADSDARFQELPTAVAAGRLVARWDSDSYPPGRYEFLATGYDLAGNAAVGADRERGGRMVLANPLKAPVSLESGFAGRGPRLLPERSVPYGRGARFGGRLRTPWGAPVGGVEVAVTETFAVGAQTLRRTTFARTGPDGAFALRLAPGPSREVSASFAGNRVLTRAAGGSSRLGVRAAVRLRASAATARVGGAPIVFSGRVAQAGAAPARRKLPVELQFRFRGAGWREFRTVETDARGRFRYAYRFSDDDSRGVRFGFRAVVLGQAGWPYEAAASRPVLVSGR